jgi:hypothetical protein
VSELCYKYPSRRECSGCSELENCCKRNIENAVFKVVNKYRPGYGVRYENEGVKVVNSVRYRKRKVRSM